MTSLIPKKMYLYKVLRFSLHEVSLVSSLITGEFKMGVRPSLPVKDVHVLLGNNIMGGIFFQELS